MPEQNDQAEVQAEKSRDPAAAAPVDLGAAYAALLDDPVWQVDAVEVAESSAVSIDANTSPANGSDSSVPGANVSALPTSLLRIVEALLFVGGGPLTTEQACAIVRGLTPADFLATLETLNRNYRHQGRPYRIRCMDNGHELVLRPKYLPLVEKMHGATREARLSSAALDVLALVAYRQPVTKQEIDGMRGAECSGVLRQLVRRGLLTVVQRETDGRLESVYQTTRRFIDLFQLRGLEDLPHTEDLQKL